RKGSWIHSSVELLKMRFLRCIDVDPSTRGKQQPCRGFGKAVISGAGVEGSPRDARGVVFGAKTVISPGRPGVARPEARGVAAGGWTLSWQLGRDWPTDLPPVWANGERAYR